jgi:hypothetical protein
MLDDNILHIPIRTSSTWKAIEGKGETMTRRDDDKKLECFLLGGCSPWKLCLFARQVRGISDTRRNSK